MLSPAEADRLNAKIRRKYVITIQHDLRRYRFRAWSATMTHAMFHVGYPGVVWHARTREGLIEKCERWARRDALRQGIRDPDISVRDLYD